MEKRLVIKEESRLGRFQSLCPFWLNIGSSPPAATALVAGAALMVALCFVVGELVILSVSLNRVGVGLRPTTSCSCLLWLLRWVQTP